MMPWLGNGLLCFGAWHVAAKRWWAPAFTLAGEAIWIWTAVDGRMWSLAFICSVFAVLAIRNLIAWRAA